ncbi:MAG: TauD/TfdA family dioxygenase [Xanthobacteraceae bacterium]|nr:TauD/TfdA family dioxygenase [Xanthobacteraceae bacterium]
MRGHKVTDRSAWKGPDLASDPSWIVPFTPSELSEIDAAIDGVRKRGLELPEVNRQTFPLPRLEARLRACMTEICEGRGFVLLRGLPVSHYSDDEVGAIFWGLGIYLGAPVKQNSRGELLGHVKDYGRQHGQIDVRGYETNAHLNFHTDSGDIVGLLCLRKAKSGGLSSIVSSTAIYNEIADAHPDCMPVLERGFYYIRRESAHSDKPLSPKRYPVFASTGGVVSCRYIRSQIEAAFTKTGQQIGEIEKAALDYVDRYANSPELRLDMDLEMGDIQLINNYTTLHSRTSFEDFPEIERRRHMLRLWLTMDSRRPVPETFPHYEGYGPGLLPAASQVSQAPRVGSAAGVN